ncbi:MAG: ribonuclease HII [Candidatus Binatia bacterium]|nr:MAG: ribonuclease HII [Candidatus Binatia bacterium]
MEELLRTERSLWARGLRLVGGCDEVGVGPLAGPVVAAAVVIAPGIAVEGVDDSKKLTALQRERLAAEIETAAVAVSVGVVDVEEVDRMNVLQAAIEAMRRAVLGLSVRPEHLLVDARAIPGIGIPQSALVDGDATSYAVAAASIVAKVRRDAMMRQWHQRFPQYGFDRNMGYGTPEHLRALALHGPCPIHRTTFAPVRQLRLFTASKPR